MPCGSLRSKPLASRVDIKPIAPQDTLVLRHGLLRPHLTPEACVYPGDDADTTIHLGAFIGDNLCGIVTLYKEDLPASSTQTGYRFRALAIVEHLRGQGHGNALLNAVEALAQELGADYLWANARDTALDFYRKAGYQIGAEEFIVEGVGPHRIVRRDF